MVSTEELNNLIEKARENGALVIISIEPNCDSVMIQYIKIRTNSVWSNKMDLITATETLRKWNNNHV